MNRVVFAVVGSELKHANEDVGLWRDLVQYGMVICDLSRIVI